MLAKASYGLEEAQLQFPTIIAAAHNGVTSVITRNGKPYAAIVSMEDLHKLRTVHPAGSGILALRGTGSGLWGASASRTVENLRGEWDEKPSAGKGSRK